MRSVRRASGLVQTPHWQSIPHHALARHKATDALPMWGRPCGPAASRVVQALDVMS
jgi:hypothetical protein